jgi:curved DNA-binding protein CbpA
VSDDHYRVLEVDPCGRTEVITAAFAVLRELCLRSEADDAPRRLAALNAAHRTLADPVRRATYDEERRQRG